MTAADFTEWKEYQKIRGPLGPQREDTYVAMVAMHAGRPYPNDADISLIDFAPPWVERDEDDGGGG